MQPTPAHVDPQVAPQVAEIVPVTRPFANGRELELVDEVLRSGVLRDGPMLQRFEERFAHAVGAEHAVAIASPVAALQLVAATHGWGSGDDLVVTASSTVPPATLARTIGVTCTEADIDPDTLGCDATGIEERIGSRTRGIVAVDAFGWPTDLVAVDEVARRHDLLVLNDVAAAFGSAVETDVVRAFTLGCDAEPATGRGAVLCCADGELAAAWRELAGACTFDSRLTDVAAAVGLAQLERLPRSIAMREMVAADYARLLAGVDGVTLPIASRDGRARSWSRFWVLLDDRHARDRAHAQLAARGIETEVPRGVGDVEQVPVAADVSGRALALPCFPRLSPQQQERIVEAIGELLAAG